MLLKDKIGHALRLVSQLSAESQTQSSNYKWPAAFASRGRASSVDPMTRTYRVTSPTGTSTTVFDPQMVTPPRGHFPGIPASRSLPTMFPNMNTYVPHHWYRHGPSANIHEYTREPATQWQNYAQSPYPQQNTNEAFAQDVPVVASSHAEIPIQPWSEYSQDGEDEPSTEMMEPIKDWQHYHTEEDLLASSDALTSFPILAVDDSNRTAKDCDSKFSTEPQEPTTRRHTFPQFEGHWGQSSTFQDSITEI